LKNRSCNLFFVCFEKLSDLTTRGQTNDITAKEALKLWVDKHLEDYNGIDVNDFAHSWKDGKAFLAILHRHKFVENK
jgi:hypothetical protein